MRLITLMVIIGRCMGECEYSESELTLTKEYGLLKPRNHPSPIKGGQTCVWKLPFEKHVGKPLFIYLQTINIATSVDIVADIKIGDEPFFSVMPTENCRLYGVNITDIDLQLLKKLIEENRSKDKYCTGWRVNRKEVQTVTFRSFRDGDSSSKRNTFKIVYDYKHMHNNGLASSTKTSTTERTSTVQSASSSVDVVDLSTQNNKRGTSTVQSASSSVDVVDPSTQNNKCGQNTTLVVIIILMTILLAIVAAALVVFVYKYRKAKNTHYSFSTTITPANPHQEVSTNNVRVENSAIPSEPPSHTNQMYTAFDQQDVSTDPYSLVADENNAQTTSVNAKPNNFMYDIPRNNREREPTANSGASDMPQHYYQTPNNKNIMHEETTEPTIRDVYAVVQK